MGWLRETVASLFLLRRVFGLGGGFVVGQSVESGWGAALLGWGVAGGLRGRGRGVSGWGLLSGCGRVVGLSLVGIRRRVSGSG
jgi:hypothetical protein